VQAVNEMGVGRSEEVCGKGCPYIRQLANCNLHRYTHHNSVSKEVSKKISCQRP